MGHPSLWGWSDFQKLKGLPSAAVSTSASSSGVTLVAMVLARRTARASPLGEAEDCKGAGMRGVLMGKRSSRSACTHQFSPSSDRLRKVLVCHGVYATSTLRYSARLRAETLRRRARATNWQAADFESVDVGRRGVGRAFTGSIPVGGDVSTPKTDAVGSVPFSGSRHCRLQT